MISHKKYRISKSITQRDRMIKVISKSSSKYGDKLLDFMEQYKLSGLQDASIEQLKEYIKHNYL